jgi:hypothetical protein
MFATGMKYSYCFIEIFWALMGDKKLGCGKVSLLYIPEEFFRA